jgi:hypothetical protein
LPEFGEGRAPREVSARIRALLEVPVLERPLDVSCAYMVTYAREQA